MEDVKKIAIVGGGFSALTAALELTERRPGDKRRFAITIYAQGWRLGGQAATSRRNMPGGPKGRGGWEGLRIEERTPHLWMGSYENAFQVIRRCYEELHTSRDAWRDAFDTAAVVGVPVDSVGGKLQLWQFDLAPASGMPGESANDRHRRSIGDYLQVLWAFWRTTLQSLNVLPPTNTSRPWAPSLSGGIDILFAAARQAEPVSIGWMIQAIESLRFLAGESLGLPQPFVQGVVDRLTGALRGRLEAMLKESKEKQRLWELVDVSLAMTRGLVKLELARKPLSSIDHLECKDWLQRNGAARSSVDNAFMTAMYGMSMAYREGDMKCPELAAGQAIFGFLRTITYRGDYLWQFSKGPGEDFFVPMYKVLKARGVKFKFFHKLTNVHLSNQEHPSVRALEFDLQEQEGDEEYEPLARSDLGSYWPAEPRFELLKPRRRSAAPSADCYESLLHSESVGRSTISAPDDFDFVVLGIPLSVLEIVAPELTRRDDQWRELVSKSGIVGTKAFQIWLKSSVRDLGLEGPPVMVTGYRGQFDTWVDMRHRMVAEHWHEKEKAHTRDRRDRSSPRDGYVEAPPLGLVSFRGICQKSEGRCSENDVEKQTEAFLNQDAKQFWPDAIDHRGKFRWDLTLGGSDHRDARAISFHYSANTDPMHLVVQTLPGTVHFRISPESADVVNLRVCGDWTMSGYNLCCAESAVMSGRKAAFSILEDATEIPGSIPTKGGLSRNLY